MGVCTTSKRQRVFQDWLVSRLLTHTGSTWRRVKDLPDFVALSAVKDSAFLLAAAIVSVGIIYCTDATPSYKKVRVNAEGWSETSWLVFAFAVPLGIICCTNATPSYEKVWVSAEGWSEASRLVLLYSQHRAWNARKG